MKHHLQALLIFAVPLSGCGMFANTEKDFLCGAQTGQPCRSISEVDGTSLLGGMSLKENATDTQNKLISEEPLPLGKSAVARHVYAGRAAYQSGSYRIPEKVGRLWIAPHLDATGILYEGTNVHFVIRNASWGTR